MQVGDDHVFEVQALSAPSVSWLVCKPTLDQKLDPTILARPSPPPFLPAMIDSTLGSAQTPGS